MRLLALGSTGFLSGAVVEAALARGHEVVAVSRGLKGPTLPGAVAVHADRDVLADLDAALAPYVPTIDAVIDTCGQTVAGAEAAASVLGGVPHYTYVSSISAYAHWPPGPVLGEGDPTFGPDHDLTTYGPMKAQSERVLAAALGGRLLTVRAGLIVGPGDRTRRLTGWLHRIATQRRVAVPADLDQPIAVVDVRDLAGWMVDAAVAGHRGPVNATGPAGMTTFGGMLDACREAVAALGGVPAELVPVPDDVLAAAGVVPWTDLPFALPAEMAATAWHVGTSRARELGLPSRPIEDSVLAAWQWVADEGFEHPPVPEHVAALTAP